MRIALLALTAIVACPSALVANEWSRNLFPVVTHDFGTVARAAKTEFRFEFENRSNRTIHIRSVRASCGCTTPIIETETVAPGERGSILAKFNTHTHTGKRQATLTVTFDQPNYTEVQLLVKGYIRSDVVFSPGEIVFGTIPKGEAKETIVDLDYAGRSDWQVLGVRANDSFVKATYKEISRQGGRVKYQIAVNLTDGAPAGALQTALILDTNDRNLKTVPIRLTANIEPSIAVSPQLLALGDLKSGEVIKQMLVLKGRQPFKVTEVSSDVFDVTFEASDEARPLHMLPLTITPREGTGLTQGKLIVKTDLAGESDVSIDVSFKIRPAIESNTAATTR
jgi:Protein of unknown function (DUF1573)